MNKKKPFISIITPTLNDKKNLKKLISNLKKQSLKNFEYIVADGGSTDGTVEYLKKMKIVNKILVSKDLNMYRGINNALKHCSGKIIGYVNSDDFFNDKMYFKKVYNAFVTKNIDCIYGGYEVKNLYTGFKKCYIPLQFKERYLVTLGMPFCQHTFFWHKKFNNQKFNLKYKVCSDFEFIGRILIKSKKIGFLNMNSATFNKRRKSFGEKNKRVGLKETKEIKKFFKNKIKFNFIFYILDRILNFLNNFKFYDNKLYIINKKS